MDSGTLKARAATVQGKDVVLVAHTIDLGAQEARASSSTRNQSSGFTAGVTRIESQSTQSSHHVEQASKSSGWLGLSKTTREGETTVTSAVSHGSDLRSAQSANVLSQHDIDVIGSRISGGTEPRPQVVEGVELPIPVNLSLVANNSVRITPAQNTRSESSHYQSNESGLLAGGPLVIGVGKQQGQGQAESTSSQNMASVLESRSGHMAIVAGLAPDQAPVQEVAEAGIAQGLPGGTLFIAGSDLQGQSQIALAGQHVLITTGQDTTTGKSEQSQKGSGLGLISVTPSGQKTQADIEYSSRTARPSTVQAGQGVRATTTGVLSIQGADIQAGEGKLSLTGGIVDIQSATSVSQSTSHSSSKNSGLSFEQMLPHAPGHGINSKTQSESQSLQSTLVPTVLKGQGVEIISTQGDLTLAAPHIDAGGQDLTLTTPGKLNVTSIVTEDFTSVRTQGSDLAWQKMQAEGHNEQTTHYTEISNANLVIKADAGITADMDARHSAEQLADQPELAWLRQITNDPELSARIDWKAIETEHARWDYKKQGLTPAAAAVVTIVVAYFTAGAGSQLGASAANAAGLGAAEGAALSGAGAVLSGAVQAGVTALSSQAAVALINNQGNIGQTLRDLGSSQNVRQLVAAMLTGGVLSGVSQSMGWSANPTDWSGKLGQNLTRNIVQANINSAVGLGKLEDNLKGAISGAILNSVGESLAGWVGDHKGPGKALDGFSSKIAHGLIGCGMGAAMGGSEGCTAGAIGALVGETAAELFNGDASKAREFTLQLSQITSVAAAALLGQDANTALMTATNAVNNNYLNHTQWAELAKELNQCKSPEACAQVRREYIKISAKQDGEMRQACSDLNSASCLNHVNDALLGSSTQQRLIEKGELPNGYFSQQNDLNAAAREYGRKIAVEEVKAICAADPECVRRGDVAKITALGATAGLLALPTVTSSMAAWVVSNPVTAVQLGVIGAEAAAAIVSGAVSPGSVAEGWLAIAATSGMKFAGPARAIARIGDETTGAFRRGAEVTKLDEVRALSAEVQGFLTSAHASFKGQALTNAGRATTKHPEYFGFGSTEELRAVYRTSSELNDLARESVGEILKNGVRNTGSGGRYPDGWVTYTLPDGRAASWSLSGEFIGFRGLKK